MVVSSSTAFKSADPQMPIEQQGADGGGKKGEGSFLAATFLGNSSGGDGGRGQNWGASYEPYKWKEEINDDDENDILVVGSGAKPLPRSSSSEDDYRESARRTPLPLKIYPILKRKRNESQNQSGTPKDCSKGEDLKKQQRPPQLKRAVTSDVLLHHSAVLQRNMSVLLQFALQRIPDGADAGARPPVLSSSCASSNPPLFSSSSALPSSSSPLPPPP
jgi:hypothetical protein